MKEKETWWRRSVALRGKRWYLVETRMRSKRETMMDTITKYAKPFDVDQHILAYWLMFCRAPSRKTGPGEPVDLGEIGSIQEKNWERLTPYSPAEPSR